MSDGLINKAPVFARQMGIVGIIMGATRDRSRLGSARLGQVLLKAHLPGLARLSLFQSGLLHLRQSRCTRWVKIVRVHASLTLKI
ncbi:hypothetical protein ILFOPFJJ_07012 [Ensifer psoraleae]|nr:hypothetical protein [Sinorhizobium psoraleae]